MGNDVGSAIVSEEDGDSLKQLARAVLNATKLADL